jgi:MFS transporter, MHS family, proline/betaine transporter
MSDRSLEKKLSVNGETSSASGAARTSAVASERGAWRAVGAAGLGTAIELYDFQLYAVLAVTFSPLFFAAGNATSALLATLAIFAVGFFVRPLGGIVFGMIGDRHGRAATLAVTIVGIGVASAGIGLLPTYASVGLLAPALLLMLRLAQGFFAGGELTGASTYIAECSPANRRGFFGAFNPGFATLGLTFATAAAGITRTTLGPEAMQEWGWRIPFLVSIPLTVVCFWARSRLEESPHFKAVIMERKVPRAPLRELFTRHGRALAKVIGIAFAQNAAGYVCLVYLNIHLTKTLGYDGNEVFWLIAVVTFVASLLMPFTGSLSDRIGRKPLLAAGLIGYMILAPVTMYAETLGSFPLTCVAVAVSVLPFIVVQSVGYPFYAELFPTRVRYSGISAGFNIATILGGGTAPYIAAWLTSTTGSPLAPSGYVAAACLVGLIALATARETAGTPLET